MLTQATNLVKEMEALQLEIGVQNAQGTRNLHWIIVQPTLEERIKHRQKVNHEYQKWIDQIQTCKRKELSLMNKI